MEIRWKTLFLWYSSSSINQNAVNTLEEEVVNNVEELVKNNAVTGNVNNAVNQVEGVETGNLEITFLT